MARRKHPLRRGLTPTARPTEWTVAAVMLLVAVIAWVNDRDTAALLAVLGATAPALATTGFAYLERRRADALTLAEAVVEEVSKE